jgi:hypothetical protein
LAEDVFFACGLLRLGKRLAPEAVAAGFGMEAVWREAGALTLHDPKRFLFMHDKEAIRKWCPDIDLVWPP